jgi:GTP-binding protein
MPPRLLLEHTADTLAQIPSTQLPHIALAGRSNVGKSSLINALAGQKKLAKVSSVPGKTRSLNFYRSPDAALYLVDLPGYGYARRSKAEQAGFSRLIEGYLGKNPALRALVLLLDCRLEPQALDIALADFAARQAIPLLPVLTKADKCSPRERSQSQKQWGVLLDGRPPLLCSAVKGFGVEELWGELRRIAGA